MNPNKQKTVLLYLIPWAILLLGCGLETWAGELTETLGAWFLLTSAFAFGLPHGACDFWILQQTVKSQKHRMRSLCALLAIYLFLALATVAVWYFAPTLALTAFLALTVWHFGSGDAIWENHSQTAWIANSLGRGLLIMASPLAFHPGASSVVLRGLTGNAEAQTVEVFLRLSPTLLLIGIVLLVIGSGGKLLSFFLLENAFLLLFFWLTPPLFAVTFYLIGVHSWRHLLRLDVYETLGKPFSFGNVWTLIVKYHQRALPLTLLSVVGSLMLIWFWQIRPAHLLEWTSVYLILLSALTVPHATLISWIEVSAQTGDGFGGSSKSTDFV